MWPFFAKFITRSKRLNAQLGEAVCITPQEGGVVPGTFFEWRGKKTIDGAALYIAGRFLADTINDSYGYIHFDINTAIRLRENLDYCIQEASKLDPQIKPP